MRTETKTRSEQGEHSAEEIGGNRQDSLLLFEEQGLWDYGRSWNELLSKQNGCQWSLILGKYASIVMDIRTL